MVWLFMILFAFGEIDTQKGSILSRVAEKGVYLVAGTALGSLSLASRLAWGVCQFSPWKETVGRECLLLSDLCGSVALHFLPQLFKESFVFSSPASMQSWLEHKTFLSKVPVSTENEKKLVQFLERRWLAKSTGFFSALTDWICPAFGINVQVHPETTSSYARAPSTALSDTYKKRINSWKQHLDYRSKKLPLILTRPTDVGAYLPSYLAVLQEEKSGTIAARIKEKQQNGSKKIVVDLTEAQEKWEKVQNALLQEGVEGDNLIGVKRVQEGNMGGILVLPLKPDKVQENYRFLLEWISRFGLCANSVEQDRSFLLPGTSAEQRIEPSISHLTWPPFPAEENGLLLQATTKLLRGLQEAITEEKWNEVTCCPTRASIVKLCFSKIESELVLLTKKRGDASFFDTAAHIEQIHASLCSLLEIFSPFAHGDFSPIYKQLLSSVPRKLKKMASCAVHSSGMTSIAGIFKATEKMLGRTPRTLYGENTYFECINAAHLVTKALPMKEATKENWAEVDLLLAQFNPSLKRVDLPVIEYRVEKIEEVLARALEARQGKPLTLALDTTLDYIDSPRVGALLEAFRKEIEQGKLNVICYRSGIKFDLFGMDNYSGAPLFMIHNAEKKWEAFDALLTDPVLLTDPLSTQWFCLAYKNTASELKQYQQQIFDNTRALLQKVPARLLSPHKGPYRIVPMEEGADCAFIDVKIEGPFHAARGAALVGGCLTVHCMEQRHPIFYRPSLGFYHPNFSMIFSKDSTTIRLTLGLDPQEVDLLAACFQKIDALNGP